MTLEQTQMLAAIERTHGKVRRVDSGAVAEQVLARCVTDTRLYMCANCHALFAIEPDGATDVWAMEPGHS